MGLASELPPRDYQQEFILRDAGANEVWLCEADGSMRFHGPDGLLPASVLCPDFPSVMGD